MRVRLAVVLVGLLAGCQNTTGKEEETAKPNVPPFGIDVRLTATEDTPLVLPLPQFSDPDGNALKTMIISTPPAAGILQLDGVTLARTEISIANAARLTFTPAPNESGVPYTSFTFQVRDDGGGSDLDPEPNRVTIDVLPNNDAPEGSDFTMDTVIGVPRDIARFPGTDPNDTPPNTIVSAIITSLPEHGTLTFMGQPVVVGQDVSSVRFTPDASGLSSSFTFQARDNGGTLNGGVDTDPTPNTATINVIEPNLPPTAVDGTVSLLEDSLHTLQISDLGFSDTRHQLSFLHIESLPLEGLLLNNGAEVTLGEAVPAMDIVAGLVTFVPPANANGAAFASFQFLVQDDGGVESGGIDTALTPSTLTFDVLSVNDAPVGADRTISMMEDQADLALNAATFGFLDAHDAPANTLAAVTFVTVPATGSLLLSGVPVTAGQTATAPLAGLVYRPGLNANGNVGFRFLVRDNGGTSNGGSDTDAMERTITFSISATNDPPAGTDATITVAEDTPRVINAADFGFDDSADSPANTLMDVTIVAAPGPTLRLGGIQVGNGNVITAASLAAGQLVYTPPSNVHGNAITTFTFQVRDNGSGANQDQSPNTLTFNVTSVNDAPSGTDTTLTLDEDTRYDFVPANFGFSDPNDTPPHAFAGVVVMSLPVVGTLLNGSTPVTVSAVVADVTQLHFVPVTNGRGAPYASFTFEVRDDAGGIDPSPNTITFNVNNVVDPPNGQDGSINMPEDTTHNFALAEFGMNDNNDTPPNAITGLILRTLPSVGALIFSGAPATTGTLIPAADVGLLSYTPPLDATSTPPNPLTSFTFAAVDDGSVPVDPTPNTLRIFVGVINDPPTNISLSGADVTNTLHLNVTTLAPGASVGTLTAADADAPNDTATFDLVAGTGDTDNARFAVDGGLLRTANTLGSGAYSVRIRVQDGGGSSFSKAFAIVLRRPPTDITLSMGTVFENHAPLAVGTLSATDPDAGETFTFALAAGCAGGGVNNNEFQIAGAQLSTTAAFNYETTPSRSVCIRVTDSNALTYEETFVITISNLNDAPTSANKTIDLNEDAVHTFSADDFAVLDEDGHTLAAVAIASLPIRGVLAASGVPVSVGQEVSATSLTYTPVLNEAGATYSSFTYRVRDTGGTANGGVDLSLATSTITFNVLAQNDAPIAQALSRSAQANMPIAYTLSLLSNGMGDVSDPDNDGPTFTLVSVDTAGCSGAVVSNVQTTGSFTFAPPPGLTGSCVLTYVVSDGQLSSTPATITITLAGPVIWFVAEGASAGNSGLLGSPFPTLARVAAVHAADHAVFVSSGTYADAFALTANERLRGDRTVATTFDSLFGITPPAGTLARPVLNGTRPTLQGTITLASGTVLSSFAATAISASGVSGATVNGVSVSSSVSISNNSGPVAFNDTDVSSASAVAVNLSGGAGAITFDAQSAIITTNGGVSVQNKTGSVRFDGPVSIAAGANIGVALTDNLNGSVEFAGGLVVTCTTGTGLVADASVDAPAAGGTLTVQATRGATPLTNSIDCSAGGALAFHNTTVVLLC